MKVQILCFRIGQVVAIWYFFWSIFSQTRPDHDWSKKAQKTHQISNYFLPFHLDTQHKKYKFFEDNLAVKQSRLKAQVPDIRANLDIVRNLKKAKEAEESLENFFKVNDGVFLKSEIQPTSTVYLWLVGIRCLH